MEADERERSMHEAQMALKLQGALAAYHCCHVTEAAARVLYAARKRTTNDVRKMDKELALQLGLSEEDAAAVAAFKEK